jgi:hypothetical protein
MLRFLDRNHVSFYLSEKDRLLCAAATLALHISLKLNYWTTRYQSQGCLCLPAVAIALQTRYNESSYDWGCIHNVVNQTATTGGIAIKLESCFVSMDLHSPDLEGSE